MLPTSLTPTQLAQMIDSTLLKPYGTDEEMVRHCAEARRLFLGIAAGCAAQLAFLLPLLPLARSWPQFLVAGGGSVAIYQLVRWALRALSPEEQRLIQSIFIRLR
jgi:hypothetical protein